jgi:SAM-dependent methyltransferase
MNSSEQLAANALPETCVGPAPDLEFTGERIVPGKTAERLFREHEERYGFAGSYVKGKEVLDVACGSGVGTDFLRRAGARKVFGFDIDPNVIAYAQARYTSCEFAKCDATDLSLPDGSVDVVVSFETLEHLRDQDRFLKECSRVLRPQGILVCSTPNTNVYRWYGTNPYHVREFTPEQFRKALESHLDQVSLFSQQVVFYPSYALRRICSTFIPQLRLTPRIKRLLRRGPLVPAMMREEFLAEGIVADMKPYRASWLVQPTYVIALGRKSECADRFSLDSRDFVESR